MSNKPKDDIQESVETKLKKLLNPENGAKPDKDDLLVLSLSIKYLAVKAKLGEEDWGNDLDKDDT